MAFLNVIKLSFEGAVCISQAGGKKHTISVAQLIFDTFVTYLMTLFHVHSFLMCEDVNINSAQGRA
jgi:hypothetical protein